jgi:DNA-binding transcriptional ArsR family regulator
VLDYDVDLDRVFHALADSGRRSMVERLTRGPASVSELGRPLGMTLSAVVQHVQVLEASGLVRTEKIGRTRTCTVEPAALRSAERWITDRRALWERRLDRLGEYLAATADDAEAAGAAHAPDAPNVGAAHPAGPGNTNGRGERHDGGGDRVPDGRGNRDGYAGRGGDDPRSGDERGNECGDGYGGE